MKKRLLTLFIFIMGLTAGYSLAMIVQGVRKSARQNGETAGVQAGVSRLDAKLKLSPGQQHSLHKILRNRRQDVAALRKEFRPKYAAIREDLEKDISAVLTPEQQKSFMEMARRAEAQENWLKEYKSSVVSLNQGSCVDDSCAVSEEEEAAAEESQNKTDEES